MIDIHPLSDSIVQVMLTPKQAIDYQAGQYVELHLTNGEHRPYSIANAPLGNDHFEFHIRHGGEDPFPDQLLEALRNNQDINISGPFGRCVIGDQPDSKPVIFIAGGTGFAPHKALIEDWLTRTTHPSMHLFWGAREAKDLYLDELPQRWAQRVETFEFTPVVKSRSILDVVAEIYPDLTDYRVFLAGPYDLVTTAQQRFGVGESDYD